jgi:hypothetical protein
MVLAQEKILFQSVYLHRRNPVSAAKRMAEMPEKLAPRRFHFVEEFTASMHRALRQIRRKLHLALAS